MPTIRADSCNHCRPEGVEKLYSLYSKLLVWAILATAASPRPDLRRKISLPVQTKHLSGKPDLVNEDAEGAGWIYKITLAKASELDSLLDREAYLALVQEQG